MTRSTPLYEGDGHFHPRPTPSLLEDGARARIAKRGWPSADQVFAVELEARRMRAETIGALLRRFSAWLERSARDAWRDRAERYLSRSTDMADLERRMRELERTSRSFG